MTKRLLRMLTVACAALGLFMASSMPAQAETVDQLSGQYTNIRTPANGSVCMAPTSDALGSPVYAYSCTGYQPNTTQWQWIQESRTDSRGGAWFIITWLPTRPNSGCLVPNWSYSGAPVVMTAGSNGCSGADYQWYAWPLSSGRFELVNGGNTNLVLDLNQSTGQLEVWTANYGLNQQWNN